MPRKRYYGRRYTRRKRQNMWTPVDGTFQVPAGTKIPCVVKVADLLTPDNDFEFTLQRARGEFIVDLGTTPSNPFYGYLYGMIFPDVVYGNDPVGTLYNDDNNSGRIPPVPSDKEGTDDFPIVQPMCIVPSTASVTFTLDSKAKRRIEREEVLSLFFQFKSATTSFGGTQPAKFAYINRTLWSVREN